MNFKQKDFDFEIKAIEPSGVFTGYGSVFDTVDQGGEVVARGAFTDSLLSTAAKNRKIPILWQHRPGEPIGVYDKITEDKHGLLMEGRLMVDDVQRSKEAHALMKAGAVTGLSIGYIVRDDAYNNKTEIRTLKRLDLMETSVVTFPMHDDARVGVVKAFNQLIKSGNLPPLSDFEDFLREAGFSKTQASIIAGRGLKELLSRSESGSNDNSDAPLRAAFNKCIAITHK